MSTSPSGSQFEISLGDQRATIVEVGGGVREYEVGGRPVLEPYKVDQMCDGAHGTLLIPWPNRLADGRYSFDGEDYQVALTEPEKHNAIHGFMQWRPWQAVEHEPDRLVMSARLHPLTGYPFTLDLRVSYLLGEGGLEVTTTAENVGERAAPYGLGQHPYLSPGSGLVDDCELHLPARTRIDADAERQLPAGLKRVKDTPFDFTDPKTIGDLQLDYAFTDLDRDESGRAWTRLRGSDGAWVEQWVDEGYPYVQIYTGDTLAPDRARRGLGAEPLSCPPNAFATSESIVRLEPGEAHTATWGVRLS